MEEGREKGGGKGQGWTGLSRIGRLRANFVSRGVVSFVASCMCSQVRRLEIDDIM